MTISIPAGRWTDGRCHVIFFVRNRGGATGRKGSVPRGRNVRVELVSPALALTPQDRGSDGVFGETSGILSVVVVVVTPRIDSSPGGGTFQASSSTSGVAVHLPLLLFFIHFPPVGYRRWPFIGIPTPSRLPAVVRRWWGTVILNFPLVYLAPLGGLCDLQFLPGPSLVFGQLPVFLVAVDVTFRPVFVCEEGGGGYGA